MTDATTAHYGWTKPTVGADSDAWGGILNGDLDQIDTALKAVSDRAFVTGMIVLWSGSAASIPAGWILCDGTGGTPNLRDRFVVGAGNAYTPGAAGGNTSFAVTVDAHALALSEIPSHSHGVTDPGHGHSVNDPGHAHIITQNVDNTNTPGVGGVFGGYSGGNLFIHDVATQGASTGISVNGGGTGLSIQANGGGAGHSHTGSVSGVLPPYYALCYIMKT